MMQLRSQSLKDERVCNGDRPALKGMESLNGDRGRE